MILGMDIDYFPKLMNIKLHNVTCSIVHCGSFIGVL
jgi:hypothetical protein